LIDQVNYLGQKLDEHQQEIRARLDAGEEEAARTRADVDQVAGDVAAARSSAVTAEEVMELIMQTLRNMQSVAEIEKRDRMISVLVNSLRDPGAKATERRFLVRMAAQLEREHVRILRRVGPEETAIGEGDNNGGVSRALAGELLAWGLLAPSPKVAVQAHRHVRVVEAPLGEKLLRYIGRHELPPASYP
jgi:hypothetical protein